MDAIVYTPIGVIRSPFKEVEGMPIQPSGATGVRGKVELAPEYAPGLKDLEGFSYAMLLYHFHCSTGYALETTPFLDDTPRGVFSTRAPKRPNPIGVSVVRIVGIEGGTIEIEDVDILDGTPVLDIKPFVPEIDNREPAKIGWFSRRALEARTAKADDRFK
jgi:tRNA (adenine37-N6)-methyltransferase